MKYEGEFDIIYYRIRGCVCMKNKKGQALVEFIILVPVLFMILFSILDFGQIYYQKYLLENHIDQIYEFYEEGNQDQIASYEKENKLTVNEEKSHGKTTLIVTQNIELFSPMIRAILKNPYVLEAKRTFYES